MLFRLRARLFCLLALLCPSYALGQLNNPNHAPQEDLRDMNLGALGEELQRIGDWDEEYPNIARAMENVFRTQGWEDESHQFSKNLVLEVAKIPPWEVSRRLQTFSGIVKERYGMSDAQAVRLQLSMMREFGKMFLRHGDIILEQTRDSIDTRAAGRPFTPEQIERWSRQAQPLMPEMWESVERVVAEVKGGLDPEHQGILENDMAKARQRHDRYLVLQDQWANGGWQPEDWGLQDDPIQSGTAFGAGGLAEDADKAVALASASVRLPSRWFSHLPETWIAYVRECQVKYGFDEAQTTAAKSIHDELVARALDYVRAHPEVFTVIPRSRGSTDPAYAPIRQVFEELRVRLDALLTRTQKTRTPG